MTTYLITGPDDDIISDIVSLLKEQNVQVFDAKAAKNARTENDSKELNLTRVKLNPDVKPDVTEIQCHAIAGYHDTKQVYDKLTNALAIVVEPESARLIADMFPDRTFEVILPHAPDTDMESKARFQGLLHIDEANMPGNVVSTTIIMIDEENTPDLTVRHMLDRWTQFENVVNLTQRFIDLKLLHLNDEGKIHVVTRDADDHENDTMSMTIPEFSQLLVDNDKRLDQFLCHWIMTDKLKSDPNVRRPKFIILGRTGTGKNKLASELQAARKAIHKEELTLLKTVTTRPQRDYNDNNYHFITPEQSANIPQGHKVLQTFIGQHEYFARKEDIEKADIMIIDPVGLKEIIRLYPDQPFFVCYVAAEHKLTDEQLSQRSSNVQLERQKYEERYQAEDAMFTKFEQEFGMFPDVYSPGTGTVLIEVNNSFDPDRIHDTAGNIIFSYQSFINMQALYPYMCDYMEGPSPTETDINDAAARLLTSPSDISDFMFTATLKLPELPLDWDYNPNKDMI